MSLKLFVEVKHWSVCLTPGSAEADEFVLFEMSGFYAGSGFLSMANMQHFCLWMFFPDSPFYSHFTKLAFLTCFYLKL